MGLGAWMLGRARAIGQDYASALQDVWATCRTRPLRSALITSGLVGCIALFRTNPSVDDYHKELTSAATLFVTVPAHLRNETAYRRISSDLDMLRTGRMQHQYVHFFSLSRLCFQSLFVLGDLTPSLAI